MATREGFQTLRNVFALMMREMTTSYGRSALGYFWVLAEPVAGILLLASVFALAFDRPSLGVSFPLFYASGLLPFMMYMDVTGKVAGSITFSRQLLFYPKVSFVDAILARLILNALTQIMVFCVVASALLLTYPNQSILDMSAIINATLSALCLALGIGSFNAYAFWAWPSWQRIWGALNRPMFILACVLFLFDDVPQPYRDYLWYNPLIHIVGEMRRGFYSFYDAPYVSLLYVNGIGVGLTAVGLLLLKRHIQDMVNT